MTEQAERWDECGPEWDRYAQAFGRASEAGQVVSDALCAAFWDLHACMGGATGEPLADVCLYARPR